MIHKPLIIQLDYLWINLNIRKFIKINTFLDDQKIIFDNY